MDFCRLENGRVTGVWAQFDAVVLLPATAAFFAPDSDRAVVACLEERYEQVIGVAPTEARFTGPVGTQPQMLTCRVRIPVESIQTRESLLTILARMLSQCGQRRTMPAPR